MKKIYMKIFSNIDREKIIFNMMILNIFNFILRRCKCWQVKNSLLYFNVIIKKARTDDKPNVLFVIFFISRISMLNEKNFYYKPFAIIIPDKRGREFSQASGCRFIC